MHIPMGQLPLRLDEVEDRSRGQPLVVYCHHGQRSLVVAHWLVAQGFSEVVNLDGGIDAWSRDVDAAVPRYLGRNSKADDKRQMTGETIVCALRG
jgi:rhodanese-related sulfurtransferase